MKTKILFFLIFGFFYSFAQINYGGKPNFVFKKNYVQTIKIKNPNLPLPKQNNVVGFAIKTNLNLKNSGSKFGNIWSLGIYVDNAQNLSFILDSFFLDKNDTLFIIDGKNSSFLGGFTEKNNRLSKIFPTQIISSNLIYFELHSQKNSKTYFHIDKIIVYKKNPIEKSQDCEVNVACADDSIVQVVKNSVCRIVYNSGLLQYVCSGSLVANTSLDKTPFVLTASHCISKQNTAETAVFYFRYETVDCQSDIVDTYKTISGSQLIATGKGSDIDFSLLKLSEIPTEDFYPYYAGWTLKTENINHTFTIHHPDGDVKKYSVDNDPPKIGSFSGYLDSSFWHIEKWDLGATEGGSSGAPLFNPQGFIIGTLTGGQADCSFPENDYFQMFSFEWNYSEYLYEKLKPWLDTFDIEIQQIFGYNPYNLLVSSDLTVDTDSTYINLIYLKLNYYGDSIQLYRNFEKIATLKNQYLFTDTLPKVGKYIYFLLKKQDNLLIKSENLIIQFGEITKELPDPITIFPNPSNNLVFIYLPNEHIEVRTIEIYDLLGKKVQIYTDKYYFNVENLSKGLYFVKIHLSDGSEYVKKLIVK